MPRLTAVLSAAVLILVSGCAYVPKGVSVVEGFDVNRYLGTWYEIGRLDHSFERGLSRVTATYSFRDDGGIRVVNRGFDDASGEWKEAEGKAYFVGAPDVGSLKVSFFGPFYGGYNVIALDREGYTYSLVSGPTRSYLWLLARRPVLEEATLEHLLSVARDLGFETDGLIYVDHEVP